MSDASGKTDAKKGSTASLSQIFETAARDHGDPGRAFVSVLDTLDQHMRGMSEQARHTKAAYEALAEEYDRFVKVLSEIPEQTGQEAREATKGALLRLEGPLKQSIASATRESAAAVLKDPTEALRRATEVMDVENNQRAARARLLRAGLPVAFLAAIVVGLIFGKLIIPRLPTTWQWPCKIIGAEFYHNQNTGYAYCLIDRGKRP